MFYNDYLKKVSGRFKALLDEISANANFDYGPEFEIALCVAMRAILPDRFGITRGWVVPATGEPAGDDLIIYDRERFSTLRMIEQNNFARKEEIPLEAVCAYIEAKHTLHIEGAGRQSLNYAIGQVQKVRVLQREAREHGTIDPYMRPIPVEGGALWWPDRRNPLFTAIIARYVAPAEGKPALRPDDVGPAIRDANKRVKLRFFKNEAEESAYEAQQKAEADKTKPDMLILGSGTVMLPYSRWKDRSLAYITPFNLPPTTEMWLSTVPDLAFGVGISSLLFALDTILLDKMPWQAMVRDALVTTNPERMTKIADLNADPKAQEPPAPKPEAKT